MRVALDTNRYTDFCRGEAELTELLEEADEILLPFAVVAELRAGFSFGKKGRENEEVLRQFLRAPGVGVLYASDATTRTYASLYRQLRQQGTPIPINDLWIAALVVEHNLVLCSRDKHFVHLPQLDLV